MSALAGSRFGGGSEQSSLDIAAQHPWYFFIPLELERAPLQGIFEVILIHSAQNDLVLGEVQNNHP